jgi:prevent-host-death family protein
MRNNSGALLNAIRDFAALLRFGRNKRGYGLAVASNRSRYASPYLRVGECYLSIAHMRTELVTTLKRKATAIILEGDRESMPVLITQHGRPAASLVDVETYGNLNNDWR